MNMKLELKHLAPYLPYGLKAYRSFMGHDLFRDVDPFNVMTFLDNSTEAKIILRPLSDLTKEIEHNGERFVPFKFLNDLCVGMTKHRIHIRDDNSIALLADYHKGYNILSKDNAKDYLIKWHFDVFNLINQGLAIDINTLTK